MLKSIIVSVILVITFAGTASAQNFIVVESSSVGVSEALTFNTGASKQFTKKWGVSSFFLVTDGWAQALVGPTYSGDSYSLGVSAGISQTTDGLVPRYSVVLWRKLGKISFLKILEFENSMFHGDYSNLWYDMDASYQLSKRVAVGIKNRRFDGVGPMLRVQVGHGASLWVAWMPLASESFDMQRVYFFGVKLAL